jgi:hypothetical protein
MSDSRPPIFDDGGGLPDVDRSGRPAVRERDVWDEAGDDQWRSPNYLIRRATVVAVVVLVIAGIALLATRLLGGDESGNGSGKANANWNSIVTVDDSAGTVVIADANGGETNRFRLGLNALIDTELIGRTLVSTDADAVAIVQLDADADITTADITTIDIAASGALVRPSGTRQTTVATNAAAERLVLVHGPSAEVIDTAEAVTVPGARYDVGLAIAEPAGRHVLVTDSGNFQSVLFSFDRDEPSFFSGLALAVNDDIVVTAANVGTNANVAVFDHTGDPGVAARTDSVRAAMISDGAVILIGVDGEVLGLALSSGDVTEIGTLSIGTVESGHVSVGGNRLIVIGTEGTAIVDGEGTVLAELPGARPTVSGLDEVAPRSTTCLVVERATAGEIAVIDLELGTVGTEALASANVLSPIDGCRPVVPTSAGYIALDVDAVAPVTLVGDVVVLSPDGNTLAVERANRVELVPRSPAETDDDDESEPVDVGRSGRTFFFADL